MYENGTESLDKRLMDEIVRKYGKELKDGLCFVQPYTVRMCRFLKRDETRIEFNTMATKVVAPDYERLIAQRQVFYTHSMGLGITKVKKVVVNTVPQHYWGNNVPTSYVPALRFSAPKRVAAGTEPAGIVSEKESLNMVFQATLNLETGLDTRLKHYDTSNFHFPPRFQGDLDGITQKPMGNFYIFTDVSNDLIIQLPSGDKSMIEGVDPDNVNAAVMEMKGFLITLK